MRLLQRGHIIGTVVFEKCMFDGFLSRHCDGVLVAAPSPQYVMIRGTTYVSIQYLLSDRVALNESWISDTNSQHQEED